MNVRYDDDSPDGRQKKKANRIMVGLMGSAPERRLHSIPIQLADKLRCKIAKNVAHTH